MNKQDIEKTERDPAFWCWRAGGISLFTRPHKTMNTESRQQQIAREAQERLWALLQGYISQQTFQSISRPIFNIILSAVERATEANEENKERLVAEVRKPLVDVYRAAKELADKCPIDQCREEWIALSDALAKVKQS